MSILMSYNYPGNIRELANVIEYAFILCKSRLIEKKHLPDNLFLSKPNHDENEVVSLRDAETGYLLKALKQNNWDRLKTARQLGMHKSTLYRKIKSFGIKIPS